MENSKKSAYPEQCPNSAAGKVRGGLTKREYFAGLAMQGILANQMIMENSYGIKKAVESQVAGMAIEYADELLRQLEL